MRADSERADPGYRDITCSFCGRHNRVVHMVGGADGLTICSVCVARCAEILDQDTGVTSPAGGWSGRWPAKQVAPAASGPGSAGPPTMARPPIRPHRGPPPATTRNAAADRAPQPGTPGRITVVTRTAKAQPGETPTARQKRIWEKNAPSYDKQIAFFEKIQFGGGREWLGERAHGRILEVAIGTGRNLPCYLAGATVTGVELSPAMLAIARQRAADLVRDADLREGDAEHLPFDDASFDTVVCALSLCTIPDPATAIGEMKRVLAPGGRLLLLDHVGSTWPPVYVAQWLLERLTIRAAGEHFTRRQLPLVKAAGFEIVEVERLKAGTVERVFARKPAGEGTHRVTGAGGATCRDLARTA